MNITDFKLNEPPVAAAIAPQNGTIGIFKCVNATATDPDGHFLKWRFGFNGGALPAGFTTTEANGLATICWDLPQGFLRGDQSLDVTVGDGYYNGETTFSVPFEVLNRNPSLVSGPTGIQTTYSNTPPRTVWSYPIAGTDPDGDSVTVYLDAQSDPAVSASGKYLTMAVTPADVGRTIQISYAVEDSFGGISPSQTVTFVVADRFPLINSFVFPEGTAGVYYSYNLPGNTFTEPDGQATEPFFSNLPEGLSYNHATNTVEGVPLEKSVTTLTKAKTFQVSVSNRQTDNHLTTTQVFALVIKPNALASQRSRLSNVNAIVGLVLGSISGAALLINGIIASRVLKYKMPDKWKQHSDKSLFLRTLKVFSSSLSICLIPSARAKAQEHYNLNFWGGKKASSSLEMGRLGNKTHLTDPLLENN